ncbi:competence protein ComEC [Firmicutes bacterium CAG:449]|nr:competence protein ComEC [Firmicutes bacterium CAG:449]
MGDAPTSIEKKIMNDYPSLDIDILKVGHHGSKTSSSYEFLKYINPQEAIISVGKNNHYHHPDKIVLTYLNDLNI